jgi:hypothetical protein
MKVIIISCIIFTAISCSSKSKNNSAAAKVVSNLIATSTASNPANRGGCGYSQTVNGATTYYNAPIHIATNATSGATPQPISFMVNTVTQSVNSVTTASSVIQATATANQKISISSISTTIGFGPLSIYFYETASVACPINLSQYAVVNSSTSLASSGSSQSATTIILSPPAAGGTYGLFLSILSSSAPTDIRIQIQ